MLGNVEAELKRMTEDDTIKPIETPTDWIRSHGSSCQEVRQRRNLC